MHMPILMRRGRDSMRHDARMSGLHENRWFVGLIAQASRAAGQVIAPAPVSGLS